jgi:hypothetical protein
MAVHIDGGEDDGGGNGVGYSWLQNKDEIEITISMKGRAVGGRVNKTSIGVVFRTRGISVMYNGKAMLELKLCSRLDVEGCTWTLRRRKIQQRGGGRQCKTIM